MPYTNELKENMSQIKNICDEWIMYVNEKKEDEYSSSLIEKLCNACDVVKEIIVLRKISKEL